MQALRFVALSLSTLAFGAVAGCAAPSDETDFSVTTSALSADVSHVWFSALGPIDERGAQGVLASEDFDGAQTASAKMSLVEGMNFLQVVAWEFTWTQNATWYRETAYGQGSVDVGAGKRGNKVNLVTYPSGSNEMFVTHPVLTSNYDPATEGCVEGASGEVLIFAQPGASVELGATQYSLGFVPGNFEQNCANPASWVQSRTVIADAAGVVRVKFAVYPDAPSGFPSIGAIRTPPGISAPTLHTRLRLVDEYTSQVGTD